MQVADPTFFLKMVPMMDGGDDVGMVLSPQCFHNLNQYGDIFNHQNIHFWEYMQPGYDALGFISCTGEPFLPAEDNVALLAGNGKSRPSRICQQQQGHVVTLSDAQSASSDNVLRTEGGILSLW